MSDGSVRVSLAGRRILLVISGGIAAYKSLDLIRRLRERGASVLVVMTAAAMNHRMWAHAATRANVEILEARGVARVGPNAGALAEGEIGWGRMSEPAEIAEAAAALLGASSILAGRRALVTSGPTREPIDPVRYISNHSS